MLPVNNELCGNYPIMPTIFREDGSLDENGIINTIEYLIWGEVDGITILANASEGFALSDYEKDRVAELVIDVVDNRKPIVVAVNHFSAKVAVEKAKRAQKQGASAIMAMPPFFGTNRADLAGVFKFFTALANSCDLPLIIQDDSVLSGINIPPEFILELSEAATNITHVKLECSQSPHKVGTIVDLSAGKIRVFGGAGGIVYLEELQHGASGTMASSAVIELGEIYNLWQEGDFEKARTIFYRILPLLVFEIYLAPRNFTKEILWLAGIISSPRVRAPEPASFDKKMRDSLHDLVHAISPNIMKYRQTFI